MPCHVTDPGVRLPRVAIGRHCCAESTQINNYRAWVGDALVDEILALSRRLKDIRICHVNATAGGGGVAELLARQLPTYRTLGLPVALKVGDQLSLASMADHMPANETLAGYAGQRVTVHGKVMERDGQRFIAVSDIE